MIKKYINIDDGSIESKFYEYSDIKKIIELYENWIKINELSKLLDGRIINTPEALSEVLISYVYNLGRISHSKTRGKIISKSMDAITKNGKKIQIKASAVNGGTTSSFSPNSNFDEIIIADFYADGLWDGTVKIFRIHPFSSKLMVNKLETFEDQQKAKRRPRFNLIKRIKSGEIQLIEQKVINIFHLL